MPSNFRLRAKNVFLTFPRCELSHDIFMDHFRQSTVYGIIAREQHADGGIHFHCGLQYIDYINVTDANYFDVAGHHCNVQGIRNWRATSNYIRKCGDYKEWGIDNTSKTNTAETIRLHAANGTKAEEAIGECVESGAIGIRGYRSYIADYNQYRMDCKHRALIPDPNFARFNACTIGTELTFRFNTKFKSKKLFIYGPPNVGKTTLLTQWDTRFTFHAPDNNDWNGFNCEFHKIIIFDEFHGQIPLSTLLKLMQGSPTRLNTKGSSVDCFINLPMLFLSNISPKNCYRNSDAFIARLFVIHMNNFHSELSYNQI